MKFLKKSSSFVLLLSLLISSNFYTQKAEACACGCGVLNVGTSSLIPNNEGGTVFLQYDQMNQARNWHGEHKSSDHNHDKRIETQTVTLGGQYMFNRDWGAAIRVPYVTRYVKNLPHSEIMDYTKHSDIGDIRVNGIYSGFFDNMSTGVTFGLKLPTGTANAKDFNRNTQIGSGSTDAILGAYHMGTIDEDGKIGYFTQVNWEVPFIRDRGFTPGAEISGALGSYYDLGKVGIADRIAPIVQITGSSKRQDGGWADTHHNEHSGYNMVFFAPGIEVTFDQFKIYADVSFPIYREVNGNQLVPQNLYKAVVAYNF